MRAGLIAPLLLLSCAETPVAPVDETRYWLEVCAAHNYSQAETAMATGKEARDVAALQQRYGARPPRDVVDEALRDWIEKQEELEDIAAIDEAKENPQFVSLKEALGEWGE